MKKIILPYKYTGGQSAKAQEVNVNFNEIVKYIESLYNEIESLQTQINSLQSTKADINGSNQQVFNVAPAIQDSHAVSLYQVKDIMSIFSDIISGLVISKTGNTDLSISKGGCLDSTRQYPIRLENNYALSVAIIDGVAIERNKRYQVFVVSSINNSSNTYCVATTANVASVSEDEVYRLIGTFSTDNNGYINEIERVQY